VVFLSQQVSHPASFFYQSFFVMIFAPGGFNSFPNIESDDIILDTKEEDQSDQTRKEEQTSHRLCFFFLKLYVLLRDKAKVCNE